MDYLKRYLNGEHEQVWDELQGIGPLDENESYYIQAMQVALETMRRVGRNCKRIISRLSRDGYVFGIYPNGTRCPYPVEPLIPPSKQMHADSMELEELAGPLPLSLKAFWTEVGAVELIGMHPSWPDGLDPVVVYPPEGLLDMLYEVDDDQEAPGAVWFAGLSPDDLHKDNISGGGPYGLYLPDPAADFKFKFERHDILFVKYLRMAILRWGGFPGLDGSGNELDVINQLIPILEPF